MCSTTRVHVIIATYASDIHFTRAYTSYKYKLLSLAHRHKQGPARHLSENVWETSHSENQEIANKVETSITCLVRGKSRLCKATLPILLLRISCTHVLMFSLILLHAARVPCDAQTGDSNLSSPSASASDMQMSLPTNAEVWRVILLKLI